MGSFGGHALPGAFFIVFAIWYTVRIFQKYYASRQRKALFKSQLMMDVPCLCGRLKNLPLEAALKIICISIGFALEIRAGMSNGKFVGIGNAQHATMFFAFGMTGVVDILLHYRAPVPADLDYITYAIAFFVEGILFRFHLQGRSELDVLVHTLLLYVIFLGAVSIFVEMRYRNSILAPLARTYLVLLQGTWFWQIGFILYNPNKEAEPWKQDNHEHLMLATLFFVWHLYVDLVLMMAIGLIMACCYRRCKGDYQAVGDDTSEERLIHETNRQKLVVLNDGSDSDSDSDIEFQKCVTGEVANLS